MSQTQLGLDPECKWTEAALAQKLGVIQQTINSWISDIRARQRAGRNIIVIRLNRLACPPSFWRSWTQEQIAEIAGMTQGRVAQIINNANFSEINNLVFQGRDMDHIDLLKDSGWEITHIIDCPMSLRAGGHATVSGKHRSPDAKKPNPGDRSTFPDYRKKEVIFKFGFWNCREHLKQLINSGLPLVFPQSSRSRWLLKW